MSFILILSLGCTFLWILRHEYVCRSPFIIVWLALFVILYIPHTLDIVSGLYYYRASTYDDASFFCLGFNLVYLFFRTGLSFKNTKVIKYYSVYETNAIALSFLEKLFVLIAFLFVILLVTQGYSLMKITWVERRSASGRGFLLLSYLWNVATVSIVYLLIVKRNVKCLFFLIIFLLMVLLLRSRGYFIPVLFPVLIYAIYQPSNVIKKTVSVVVIAGIIMFLVVNLVIIRHMGSLESFLERGVFETFQSSITYVIEKKGDLSWRFGLYQFIEKDNQFKAFGQGVTYRRIALLPIPTSLSVGLKPPDLIYDMASAMGMEGEGSSYHPTLYGDVYANFGWPGFGLGAFYAFVAFVSDYILLWARKKKIQLILLSPFCYFYVFVARGSVYNAFALAFWCGIFVILLVGVLSPRRNRRGV